MGHIKISYPAPHPYPPVGDPVDLVQFDGVDYHDLVYFVDGGTDEFELVQVRE